MRENKLYYKLARTIIKAGSIPLPVSDSLIRLLKELITLEQAEFIVKNFKKPSRNISTILLLKVKKQPVFYLN